MVENQQQSSQIQTSQTNFYKKLFFISILVLLLSNSLLIYKNSVNLKNIKNQANICPTTECPVVVPPVPIPTTTPSVEMTCGGISGAMCPTGYNCHLNGTYPGASGVCVVKTIVPKKYSCPASEWVDCMPSVDISPNYQCETAFLTWAKANCPGFKGAAL